YETAAFVSGFPLNRRFGLARGFDLYDDRFPRGDATSISPYTERRADQTFAAVRRWVENRRSTGEKRPFFLWVHFFDPHRPYDPPEPFRSDYRDRPYDGEIAFVDRQIGQLLNLGITQLPTIVAITADHGEGLGEHDEPTHGLLLYDTTIRVPLIFVGPGIPRMATLDTPARQIDIAPTLLDLAALPPFPGVEGRSLAPSIRRTANPPGEPAYIESMFGRLCCGWAPLHGWRAGKWMFIDG